MGSEGSDLLIFSERGYESPKAKAAKKPAQQERAIAAQPVQKAAKEPGQPQGSQAEVKDLYCTNHPWRKAYAICDKCKLPYCYVDIIEYKKKTYCLQDIDFAAKQQEKEVEEVVTNNFSMVASALFLANSVLLLYFTYQQASFMFTSAAGQGLSGAAAFFLNLNPQYYVPLANTLIIVFGFVSAVAILRRSISSFGFSFFYAFITLFIIAYEYLNSNVTYLLMSSIILLLTISFTTYSRMSSTTPAESNYNTLPSVEWPKPESF